MKISQLDPRNKIKQRFISPIKNHCSPIKLNVVFKPEDNRSRPSKYYESKIRKICSLNPEFHYLQQNIQSYRLKHRQANGILQPKGDQNEESITIDFIEQHIDASITFQLDQNSRLALSDTEQLSNFKGMSIPNQSLSIKTKPIHNQKTSTLSKPINLQMRNSELEKQNLEKTKQIEYLIATIGELKHLVSQVIEKPLQSSDLTQGQKSEGSDVENQSAVQAEQL